VTMNLCDKRGFTLIEVMVTLIILAFGMLASVVGIMTALDHSLMNEMRNDAMKLAQEQAEWARNIPYTQIQNIPVSQTITRQVRKTSVAYNVKFNTLATAGAGSPTGMTLMQFIVQWSFKNNPYTYTLQSIVRQMQ